MLLLFNTSIAVGLSRSPWSKRILVKFITLAGKCAATAAAPRQRRISLPHSVMWCAMLADEARTQARFATAEPLVARRGHLSDLSAQLRSTRRRRHRRPAGHRARSSTMSPASASTAIWLSPFFTSPMTDFGYDVADYCGVDPVFGTLADFDALVAARACARAESDHRPGLFAHLRPASLV